MTGALVAVQFALSLVLLVGTGLLLKSFQRLLAVDPGFDAARLLTMSVYLPPQNPAGYAHPFAPPTGDEGRRTARFYGSLIESVLRVRGVRAAGLVSALPLSGDADSDGTVVEGHEPPGDAPVPVTQIFRTSPGYFRAMGITLVRGRDFSDHDREGSMPVAIVDDTLARRYWPDGDAIGKRIRYSWDTEPNAWKTIVGVVSGIRAQTLADGMEPHLYLPFAHEPLRSMSLVVRTETDPAAAAGAVREALRGVDPGVPAYAVRSMEETIGGSLAPRKITSLLLAAFPAISLLLSAAGIYGVMSLEVAGRLKELAIRLALGARPVEVFGLVIGRGARLAAAGVAAGVAGALAVTRLLEGLLFEVTPADPAVFASVVVVLAVVAVLGCAIPGRRASRVDPIVTLRND